VGAREHLERGAALYDRDAHRALTLVYGQDLGMSCLCYSALALFILGYPEQSKKRSEQALTLAHDLSHPFSLVWCLTNLAILKSLCRDWSAGLKLIDEGLTVCEQGKFLASSASLMNMQSVIRGARDGITGSKPAARPGEPASPISGHLLHFPWHRTLLAQGYGKTGQVEKALSLVESAFTAMQRSGERFYEAEMFRVQGELLLQQRIIHGIPETKRALSDPEAEQCLRTALETARRQNAKSFELRAATSLGRLLQREGRRVEARDTLWEIYNWFTEGHDTQDLLEAQGLMKELE
jgi:predicted ATPase